MTSTELGIKGRTIKWGVMNSHKASRVNDVPQDSKEKEKKTCLHGRLVEYHRDKEGNSTGNLVCRECGTVVPDPLKTIG